MKCIFQLLFMAALGTINLYFIFNFVNIFYYSVINVNSAVRELLRQTKSGLLNKYIFDLIHPDDIPCFVKVTKYLNHEYYYYLFSYNLK